MQEGFVCFLLGVIVLSRVIDVHVPCAATVVQPPLMLFVCLQQSNMQPLHIWTLQGLLPVAWQPSGNAVRLAHILHASDHQAAKPAKGYRQKRWHKKVFPAAETCLGSVG
jgi:hypothetical protein